jgi:hypothetical protein
LHISFEDMCLFFLYLDEVYYTFDYDSVWGRAILVKFRSILSFWGLRGIRHEKRPKPRSGQVVVYTKEKKTKWMNKKYISHTTSPTLA